MLVPALDLGAQPAGGRFPHPDDLPQPRLPLRLGVCGACGLAQLVDPSPHEPEELDSPSPLSSTTMSAHAREFVEDLIDRGLATGSSRILSIASHGGHLAPFMAERGLRPTILEPNAARAARLEGTGMPVIASDPDGHDSLGLAPASMDVVVDSYLLAHLERPRVVVRRLVELLAPGGVLVLEFDHLLATIEGAQWDAVNHGHPLYLTLRWITDELERAGLRVTDAVPQRVYGGALRVFATAVAPARTGVQAILAREAAARIDRAEGMEPLREAVERARRDVVAHLERARAAGRLVVGYGAPERAVVFLNALGITSDLLPFVVDRAPVKQGRLIPGVRIPIRSPDVLERERPDEVLILTWNLATEVVAAQAPLLGSETRFLVAIPRLVDVGAPDPG